MSILFFYEFAVNERKLHLHQPLSTSTNFFTSSQNFLEFIKFEVENF